MKLMDCTFGYRGRKRVLPICKKHTAAETFLYLRQ
jgi:hypothetical protein